MKQLQELSKYSIRKLAKGAGALLISSVLLFNIQQSASAEENFTDSQQANNQTVTDPAGKEQHDQDVQSHPDTTNPEIQSITMDKKEYAPGEIAIATLIVKDESNLTDVSIGFTNTTQVGAPSLSSVAEKENIEKIGEHLWKVTLQIYVPEKIGDTSYKFSGAIVDDAAENGTTIAPELGPSPIDTKDLSFKVVNGNTSNVDTELPQFDSVTLDKSVYAPGDVIKAQLKIADKSVLKEVTLGFENYPDNGLRGLSKFADLSNVQRNSEGQWVVNIDIPVPNDLAEGSYKFSHISATDEYGNAYGLIDVPEFETKFHDINFKIGKAENVNDKKTDLPEQPQDNTPHKDTNSINTGAQDAAKPTPPNKEPNQSATQQQPMNNDTNQKEQKPTTNDKGEQNNKDVTKDKEPSKVNSPSMSQVPTHKEQPDDPNVNTPMKDTKKDAKEDAKEDANSAKDKELPMPKQTPQNKPAQTDDIAIAQNTSAQGKVDDSKDNKGKAMLQDKKATSSTAKDVSNKSQVTDKQSPNNMPTTNPKKDATNKVSQQSGGQHVHGTSQNKKEQPSQSNSQDRDHQQAKVNTQHKSQTQVNTKDVQATDKKQQQPKVDNGTKAHQLSAQQQHTHTDKSNADMPKQATKDDVKANKGHNNVDKNANASSKVVVAKDNDMSKAMADNKNVKKDKQQQSATKEKANNKDKQLPKTGMMDNMRDYFIISVIMAAGLSLILLRKYFIFK